MKPVGLTRAEEASQQEREPQARIAAPLGTVRCRISVSPNGDDCVAAATKRIVWRDGDKTPACADCVLQMQQQLPGAIVRIEPLGNTTIDNR